MPDKTCAWQPKVALCRLYLRYIKDEDGMKAYFCLEHQQWVYEWPMEIRTTFTYKDDSEHRTYVDRNKTKQVA